ncbi:MAG: hypothetical protein D3914_03460 [Candidatus Electrothrix sp. LOE2]|jgi:hypothetical protein|nr:hypothetical protein [Candidatus Electrothrix sp. LOE2]
MITKYVIVEGVLDKFLLERILPEEFTACNKIIVGNGDNLALSKARSLLVASDLPVVLIVDSDSTEHTSIEEKRDFMVQSLQQFSQPDHFQVVLAVPELEIIFFSSRTMIEELVRGPITDQQWESAHYRPKRILRDILQTENIQSSLADLLTPTIIEKLRETSFVQDIINSFRAPAYTV